MNNLKKNYFWNTIGTTLLSFNSLFLMIIVTRINGISQGGIFSFSFAIAGIINFIALYYGRTYQVADDNSIYSESVFVISRYFTSFLAIVFAFFFVLLNDYTLEKSFVLILLCLVKCFEAISDIYYGIVQKRDKLYISGKSLTYKSLLSLLGFILIDLVTNNLILCCVYLVVLNFLFILFYDIFYVKKEIKINYKIDFQLILGLLKKSIYTFMFTLLVLIIINIPRYMIDFMLTDADQGIYGILSMPATFISLFSQFILQPSLVKLSNYYQKREVKLFKKTILSISTIIAASLIVILPVAYFLGIPVLEFIYGINLSEYKILLIVILIGSDLYAISNVLLNSLIVIKCTKEQFVLQIVVFVISIISCYSLISNFGLNGGIWSYFFILMLQFVFYVILYNIVVNKKFKR